MRGGGGGAEVRGEGERRGVRVRGEELAMRGAGERKRAGGGEVDACAQLERRWNAGGVRERR